MKNYGDFKDLKKLLSKQKKVLPRHSDTDLKNIGRLEEILDLPTEDIGGLEEILDLPTEDIGGLEEILDLPSEDIGGLEEILDLPSEDIGGLEEILDLPTENIGGLEEILNLPARDIGRSEEMPNSSAVINGLNEALCHKLERTRFKTKPQPNMLSSTKPAQPIPAKKFIVKSVENKGKNQKDKDNKPMSMSDLCKYISERVPLVVDKNLLYYYDDGIFKPCLQRDFLKLFWENLSEKELSRYNLSIFKNAYTFIASMPGIKDKEIPEYTNCAVCNNYMVNVLSGQTRKISPYDFVTSRINANFIWSGNVHTPVFDDFLSCVSNGNEQLERLICEVIGKCCMLPDHSQKVFFVLGYAHDSEKSVIGNFLKKLYGDDLVSYVTIDEMGRGFGLSSIVGKAINISMDLPGSALNSAAVSAVKMLTGGDGISIDIKYMSPLQYKQPIHLIFASNHPIKLKQPDEAFFRRMVFVPFNVSIPPENQDPELVDKLWEERDGIVTKCLSVVRDMLKEGRSFSCEPYDPNDYYNDVSDTCSIRIYVNENIALTYEKSDELSTTEMYGNYTDWCKSNGLTPESQRKFSKFISEKYGIEKRKKHTSERNIWVFIGVQYISP